MKKVISINLFLSLILAALWVLINYLAPYQNSLPTEPWVDIIVALLMFFIIGIVIPYLISLFYLLKNKETQKRVFIFLLKIGRLIMILLVIGSSLRFIDFSKLY